VKGRTIRWGFSANYTTGILSSALFFFTTDTTHHDHRSILIIALSINWHSPSMTSRNRDKRSNPTLDNTRYNAGQQSNSKRTLACDAECHVAPGLTYPSSVGRAGQDGFGVDRLISHDSIDAGACGTNHDPKIKFSGGTKERDQSLTKREWRKRNKETAQEERDAWWRKLDPNAPNHPEIEELEMDCWDKCKDEEEEAKIKQRAKEKRAMLDAPGDGRSSQESE
jgi:hypothetical protein